jgi:hypothetical protein
MKLFIKILVLISLTAASGLYAQAGDTTDSLHINGDTTNLITTPQEERLFEDTEIEDEESQLLDYLESLQRNPYDLNTVTRSELETIPFLNAVTANNIIQFRNEIRYFNSKRALLQVEGINDELYEKIKIYLVVRRSTVDFIRQETGEVVPVTSVVRRGVLDFIDVRIRSRFIQDLQTRAGFLTGTYEGTKPKIYNQANFKYSTLDYGLEGNVTIEKDPGERTLTDFSSAYLQLKDYNFIKKAVAGDYILNFAQGVALWTTLSFAKGIEAVNPLKKKGKGIDGYRSVNEVQFFRGGAVNLNHKQFNLDLFYSDNYYDASVDTTLNQVSSLYFDGFHRTESERDRKNSVKERLIGGRLVYQLGSLKLGSTYWTSKFNKPLTADDTRQLFRFEGTEANMIGADYDFIFQNMNFYGEWARSQSKAIAGLSAVHITFFRFADILFLYRNYPADFTPVHSFAFGERNGNTVNERGFYAGITMKPVKGLTINSYFDQYKFPYRTFFDPVPTEGKDFLTNIEWRAAKGFVLSLKYKNEDREDTRSLLDEFGRDVRKIDNRIQTNARVQFSYEVTSRFRVRSRYEYVYVDYKHFGGDVKGYLFFSDFRFVPVTGLVLDTRYVFFNTNDYDSRIYEFENDIKGVLSNVPLYGQGRRWYVVAKYKPFNFMEISGKYSETYIDGATTIGTGNDRIDGDINNRLSLSIEMLF